MDKMKRMAALLLAVFLLLPHLPVTTLAADGDVIEGEMGTEDSIFGIVEQGDCGDDLEWVFYDDGILLIRGTGDMWDYTGETAPWSAYRSDITDLVLRQGITSIGDFAFYNCINLRNVKLPESLCSIGQYAFSGCREIPGTLDLPEGLTTIGQYAFKGCKGITALTIPAGVATISDHAFAESGLKDVVLSEGVRDIATYAFYSCRSLTKMTIPASVTSVGRFSFYYCTALTEMTFVGEVPPTVADRAFENANAFTIAYAPAPALAAYKTCGLPSNVELRAIDGTEYEIVDGVLYGYYGLGGEITIPDEVTEINGHAFYGNTTVTKVTVPESVEKIGQGAFRECTALEEVILPDGITAIEYDTFYGCTSLKRVVLPENLTSIGESAFAGCTALREISLPASLKDLGNYVFQNCTGITKLNIPDQVSTLPAGALSGMSNLNTLVLGETLSNIEVRGGTGHALYGLDNLCTITFESVPVAGPSSSSGTIFDHMPNLETVYVPASSYISYVNAYSKLLSEEVAILPIPGSEFVIRDGVLIGYYGSSAEVVIPEEVTVIGSGVFQACTSIVRLVLPEGLTEIADHAFNGCVNLTEISFHGEVPPAIGSYALSNTGLTTVYVPATRYTLYKNELKPHLPEGVVFKALGTVEPQLPTCTITEDSAVITGDALGDYMNKNALLLMAAYDGDGRFLGASETVSQVVGGTYRMTIEAEGIAKVQLFVMDWGNTPLKEAYIFE